MRAVPAASSCRAGSTAVRVTAAKRQAEPVFGCCRAVDCGRQEWSQSSDVKAANLRFAGRHLADCRRSNPLDSSAAPLEATDLSFKNCVGTATYRFSPSVKTCGFDSSPIRWSQGTTQSCLPLMRKVSARLVAMTEGENYMSFEILNQWISKRGFVLYSNRIETQNLRPLSLWGRGFVIYNTAVAACRLSLQVVPMLSCDSMERSAPMRWEMVLHRYKPRPLAARSSRPFLPV